MDALVGVRAQIGPGTAAAMVSMKGYTAGAVSVAADEDVALVRLRPFDEATAGPFVRRVEIEIRPLVPQFSDWGIEVWPDHGWPPDATPSIHIDAAQHLLHLDGSPAERVFDVLQHNSGPCEMGSFPRRAEFTDGRMVPTLEGRPLPIRTLTWTETNRASAPTRVVREMEGQPVLVVEELDQAGSVASGRVVVDDDLYAWDIDDGGRVVPRGLLLRGGDTRD